MIIGFILGFLCMFSIHHLVLRAHITTWRCWENDDGTLKRIVKEKR